MEWYSDLLDAMNLVLWCYQRLKVVCTRNFAFTTARIGGYTSSSSLHNTNDVIMHSYQGKVN